MKIGRFAPSPTGPLHFGSLVCALASFLDIRSSAGRWHLRIEDLDPPRTIPDALSTIPEQLIAHGFEWDGPTIYQSHNTRRYEAILEQLISSTNAYYCDCSRAQIKSNDGSEGGICLTRTDLANSSNTAIRLPLPIAHSWVDQIYGRQAQSFTEGESLVLRRRDNLIAYPLAVVVDDYDLKVNRVLRGSDLLDVAAGQQVLYHHLGWSCPDYLHIPVAANALGQKLSKQNLAPSISNFDPASNLRQALKLLNQTSAEACGTPADIIRQAVQSWDIDAISKQMAIEAPPSLALN